MPAPDLNGMRTKILRADETIANLDVEIQASVHKQHPWIVIVEPDVEAERLVVVTPYEVSK